jgi:alpha-tubulin suppressor-like RCC1 family protein
MSCGAEAHVGPDGEIRHPGLLGHGELDAEHRVAATLTLLPSVAEVRFRGVAAGGDGFGATVSAEGKVYTWCSGETGRLGHGDEESCLIPKQVQGLAEIRVLAVAAGRSHGLAVTERGEVFSWGRDHHGKCGHGSDPGAVVAAPGAFVTHLLPRRVEVLAGVRVRSASAGALHSLVVTEEGALYSFGPSEVGASGSSATAIVRVLVRHHGWKPCATCASSLQPPVEIIF